MPQCFSRLRPGAGDTAGGEQEQGERSRGGKGFMVERIRARQSATSLLGAQASAGVWPGGEAEQNHREHALTHSRPTESRWGDSTLKGSYVTPPFQNLPPYDITSGSVLPDARMRDRSAMPAYYPVDCTDR